MNVRKYVAAKYSTVYNGYTVKTNKYVDHFRLATSDDKWREYMENTTVIDRGGFVWSRIPS
jgi:hypothetical protein